MILKDGKGKEYFLYKKEQCEFCINRKNCVYKNDVMKFYDELGAFYSRKHKESSNGIWGSVDYRCDYWNIDKKAYEEYKECEVCCVG